MEERFATDQGCRAYLASLRWPRGFVCPSCGGRKAWPVHRGRLVCAACRYQASVTAGTIFQDSRLPLRLWCRAIWQVTSQKNGASALGLQRVLGLGSYQTAWTFLHKLRRAMVRPGRDKLSGRVEVGRNPRGWRDAATERTGCSEQGVGRDRGPGSRCRHWTHPSGAHSRCHRAPPPPVHPGGRCPGEPRAYRRSEAVSRAGSVGLSTRGQYAQRPEEKRRHRNYCRGCIGWPPCSIVGCWERTKVRLRRSTWIIIWMSSPFVSIAGPPPRAASSFIAWRNKRCRCRPFPIERSWAAQTTQNTISSGEWSR